MYNTATRTQTYTVLDVRKTFESFLADLRMISRRTEKWTQEYAEDVHHDVLAFAEAKYLSHVDISLMDTNEKALRASRFVVSPDGTKMNGERAGGNNWPNIEGSTLRVIVSYTSAWHKLTEYEKSEFSKENSLRISWVKSDIDTRYLHLSSGSSRTYANKGYELNRTNFS